jgi:hypothetical protein
MEAKMWQRIVAAGVMSVMVAALVGCSVHTQTTSGEDYLQKYDTEPSVAGRTMDEAVRASAAVEPLLSFPARIGIARISNGTLTPVPPPEAEAWMKLADQLGPSWGEFVPVSPLIAKLASDALPNPRNRPYGDAVARTIELIRVGAARQHVETVLIYEVAGRSSHRSTPLALTDFTVVGLYVVPSRLVRASGIATALLVDVRNGYPYGFTDPVIVEDSVLSTSDGTDASKANLQLDAELAATTQLVGKVDEMLKKLRPELEARRIRASAAK